jgi:hypothetical protein
MARVIAAATPGRKSSDSAERHDPQPVLSPLLLKVRYNLGNEVQFAVVAIAGQFL